MNSKSWIKDFIIDGSKRFVYERYFYMIVKKVRIRRIKFLIVNSFQRLYISIRLEYFLLFHVLSLSFLFVVSPRIMSFSLYVSACLCKCLCTLSSCLLVSLPIFILFLIPNIDVFLEKCECFEWKYSFLNVFVPKKVYRSIWSSIFLRNYGKIQFLTRRI